MHRQSTQKWQLPLVLMSCLYYLTGLTDGFVHHAPRGWADEGWVKGARTSRSRKVPMHISVASPKSAIDAAVQQLYTISDPMSEGFGEHWDAAKVSAHFAPTSETVENIITWLGEYGISRSALRISKDRSHIFLNAEAWIIERLLDTRYYEFHDSASSGRRTGQPTSDGPRLAVENYTIPDSLRGSINFIEPTFLDDIRQQKKLGTDRINANGRLGNVWNGTAVNCLEYVSPQCLRLLYNMPFDELEPQMGNTLGVFQSNWQTFLPEDLDSFFTRFEPQIVGARPIVKSISGGELQYNYTDFFWLVESSLDFEYTLSLTNSVPVVDLLVGFDNGTDLLGNMLASFDESSVPPSVISISYAFTEADYQPGYLEEQCLGFLKLGLQGVTVIASSGDWGVADQYGQCINPATGQAEVYPGDQNGSWHFSSTWPASCPWVTTVGGTELASSLPDGTTPTWNKSSPSFPAQEGWGSHGNSSSPRGDSSSAGGFSRVFPAPDYQASHTASYLSSQQYHTETFQSHFNARGRGYPDIAALASDFLVVYDGGLYTVSGTSASAPVFASMITRINNERLSKGKKTVGFVNPVLYQHSEIFEDVVEGANSGCGINKAFRAAEGWDAVTGLGAPDFGRLRDTLMALR
jgi:tripeptidyl-peptidase I